MRPHFQNDKLIPVLRKLTRCKSDIQNGVDVITPLNGRLLVQQGQFNRDVLTTGRFDSPNGVICSLQLATYQHTDESFGSKVSSRNFKRVYASRIASRKGAKGADDLRFAEQIKTRE